jgi:hypothetical protein
MVVEIHLDGYRYGRAIKSKRKVGGLPVKGPAKICHGALEKHMTDPSFRDNRPGCVQARSFDHK